MQLKKTVLIIGSGGREHALGWKLSQSKQVGKIYFAPGNGGTESLGENIDIQVEEINKLISFAKKEKIDLTVVGPEIPLTLGIVDEFIKNNLMIFGPVKSAARLESDKSWACAFMDKYNIPYPASQTFTDFATAKKYIESQDAKKIVIKASGLAAGKGVILPATKNEAIKTIEDIMIKKIFGESGKKVLIQERISGPEVSIIAITDGKNLASFPPSQDHKQVFDKDRGPNTGGMGAYAPVPFVTTKLLDEIEKTILIPTIKGMQKEGINYKGVLYAGLMLTKSGPKVLEYNARFGDPETEPLMMELKSDLYELMVNCINGKLKNSPIKFYDGYSVGIVISAGGYPGSYKKGEEIMGLDPSTSLRASTQIFHAGTVRKNNEIQTNGGRVLCISTRGKNLKDALKKAYSAIGKSGVNFKNMHYRKDIGYQSL